MRARSALFVLALMLTVASAYGPGRAQAAGPQSTRPVAPDFAVKRVSDGRSVSLSDMRGKVVLLFFFFPT